MRNHEVINHQLLLDSNGELREPGWSRSQVQQYRRSMIKAPAFRIKEWDYYLVLSDKFAGAFTISDDGYVGLQSVSLLTLSILVFMIVDFLINYKMYKKFSKNNKKRIYIKEGTEGIDLI